MCIAVLEKDVGPFLRLLSHRIDRTVLADLVELINNLKIPKSCGNTYEYPYPIGKALLLSGTKT